jgi:hypothetical protein
LTAAAAGTRRWAILLKAMPNCCSATTCSAASKALQALLPTVLANGSDPHPASRRRPAVSRRRGCARARRGCHRRRPASRARGSTRIRPPPIHCGPHVREALEGREASPAARLRVVRCRLSGFTRVSVRATTCVFARFRQALVVGPGAVPGRRIRRPAARPSEPCPWSPG